MLKLYKVLLSSDNKSFGGSGSRNYKITTHKKEYMNFDGYIEIKLKSFSAIYLEKFNGGDIMFAKKEVVAMLAGGQGSRLEILTKI